jgi:hypothetical protein
LVTTLLSTLAIAARPIESLKWCAIFIFYFLFAGKQEKEYEMTLKRTLQSICLLTVHPNTTTSVILQV